MVVAKEKITFKEACHSKTNEPIVEIWKEKIKLNGEKEKIFVGAIYFHEDYIKIISKYFASLELKHFPVPYDTDKIAIELKIFFRI